MSPTRQIATQSNDTLLRARTCAVSLLDAAGCRWTWWRLVVLSASVALALVWARAPSERRTPISLADVFAGATAVSLIDLTVAPSDLERLRVDRRSDVPVEVRLGGHPVGRADVHVKGSRGSVRSIDDKPSLTLDFERYADSTELLDVPKIHLNNSVEDPTYVREMIGNEVFRAAGIPTPRVAHAVVRLNGRALGLYVLKEAFSRRFLQRHFANADGALYEPEGGHDVDQPMRCVRASASAETPCDLDSLAAAAREPDLQRRWALLGQVLEVGRFIDFLAVEVMICHWDGYGMGQNNFRLYCDPATGKAHFLPSGMDQVFAKADFPWRLDLSGLMARAIMETPEGRRLYEQRFRALCASLLRSESLTRRVDQIVAALRPHLGHRAFREVQAEAAELCEQVVAREVFLQPHIALLP